MSMFKQDSKSNLLASAAALSIIIASVGGSAFAQATTKEEAEKAKTTTATAAAETIVVKGIRASNQSAIARQKNGSTAMDSIVAEDVGTFPDKSIAEALSRVAGVSLDRGGNNGDDGVVTVRGMDAEAVKIELDGLPTSTGGGFGGGLSGGFTASEGANSRATDLRYLPSDLIKSVDVIKGSTAELAGNSAGLVRIETRTGLDFAKPYFQIRASVNSQSNSDVVSPDFNVIYSRKFLGGKLGFLYTGTYSKFTQDGNQRRWDDSNVSNGMTRSADLDNSANKTFTYTDAGANTANFIDWNSIITATGAAADFARQNAPAYAAKVLSLSGQAATKADCENVATAVANAGFASSMGTGTTLNNNRNFIRSTCLSQWNDYVPNNMRYISYRNLDERISHDVRFDYKFSDSLNLFVKYNKSDRVAEFEDSNFGYSTPNSTLTNITAGSATFTDNHVLKSYAIPTASFGINATTRFNDYYNNTLSGGFNYRKGPWRADLTIGRNESVTTQQIFSYQAAGINTVTLPGGISGSLNGDYSYSPVFPSSFDLYDINNYAVPISGNIRTDFRLNEGNSSNNTINFTASRKITEIPFIKRIAAGYYANEFDAKYWNGANTLTPMPGVFLPRSQFNNNTFVTLTCPATVTTGCVNGQIVASGTGLSGRDTTTYFSPTYFKDALGAALKPAANFYGGYDDRTGIPSSFPTLDAMILHSYLGSKNMNDECLKVCIGTDGKTYDMPYLSVTENNQSAYLQVDFSQDLPLNLRFDGNIGTRYYARDVDVSGTSAYNRVTKNAGWSDDRPIDPLTNQVVAPNAINCAIAANAALNWCKVTTTTFASQLSAHNENDYWTPSYNAALWFSNKLAIRWYNGVTITPPQTGRLIPIGGTCTFDDRIIDINEDDNALGDAFDDIDLGCSGAFGNPALKPFKALNRNYSLEYYLNRDTYFKISQYKNSVRVGNPNTRLFFSNVDFFGDGTQYGLSQWVNGPTGSYSGKEYSTKIGLTFLPWKFKYLGLDANYTKTDSTTNPIYDMVTGEALVPGVTDWTGNASLWYDDGKLNMRIAAQRIGPKFLRFTGYGDMRYLPNGFGPQSPSYSATTGLNTNIGYNPGNQRWQDEQIWVDAKISYKINKTMELSAQVRNMTNEEVSQYELLADGTKVPHYYNYTGRAYNIAFVYRYGAK